LLGPERHPESMMMFARAKAASLRNIVSVYSVRKCPRRPVHQKRASRLLTIFRDAQEWAT
jgi:hypothetical protein